MGYEDEINNIPANELDYFQRITDPSWSDLTEDMKDRLSKIIKQTYNEGSKRWQLEKEERKTLLEVYKRDLRLGNLSKEKGLLNLEMSEMEFCMIWLNIATDCLTEDYPESFRIALSRVISVLELSQSREGFMRKQMNTISMETKQINDEPKKKSIFNTSR